MTYLEQVQIAIAAAAEANIAQQSQPLSAWVDIRINDIVLLRATGGREYLGTVEAKTSDGLIMWMRDDLNDRKLFHSEECLSIRVVG